MFVMAEMKEDVVGGDGKEKKRVLLSKRTDRTVFMKGLMGDVTMTGVTLFPLKLSF